MNALKKGLFFLMFTVSVFFSTNVFAQSCGDPNNFVPSPAPTGNLVVNPAEIKEITCTEKCGLNGEKYAEINNGVGLQALVDENRSTVWSSNKYGEGFKIVLHNVGYPRLADLEMKVDPNIDNSWVSFVAEICDDSPTGNCRSINDPYIYRPAPDAPGTIWSVKNFTFPANGLDVGYQNWFYKYGDPIKTKTLYIKVYQTGRKYKGDANFTVTNGGDIAGVKLYN